MDGDEKPQAPALSEEILAMLAQRGFQSADGSPLKAEQLTSNLADIIDGFRRERIEHLTTIDVLVKRLAAKR